jgi:hypothetical protein
MGELQAGFKKGIGAVQRQMSSGGPIKFKFQLDPVSKGAATPKIDTTAGGYVPPAIGGGAGGSSEASKKAVEDSKRIAEQMREQSAAARQVTQELVLQNAASNEMRELEISLIGMASQQANLIRSNAQARKLLNEFKDKLSALRGRDLRKKYPALQSLWDECKRKNGLR